MLLWQHDPSFSAYKHFQRNLYLLLRRYWYWYDLLIEHTLVQWFTGCCWLLIFVKKLFLFILWPTLAELCSQFNSLLTDHYFLVRIMSSDSNHMTWLGGVKQETQNFQAGFESSVNEIKCSIDSKFNYINDQLKDIRENFTQIPYMI